MKPFAACLAVAALLAPSAQAEDRRERFEGDRAGRRGYANPSAVIAAEIGFNRLAQEKGQWTAFLATADPAAEMFVPQRVSARTWLKRRPDPPRAITWAPHAVWSSCDGSTAVTQGAWRSPRGKAGVFVTVWQRQPKKRDYRWVLAMSSELEKLPETPEAIAALVADCTGAALAASPSLPLQAGDDARTAVSRDGSLRWTSAVSADGSRRFRLTMRRDGEPKEVIELTAAGEPAG